MPQSGWSWGQNGHRAIGEIAQYYLKKRAQKKIKKLLNGQSIAMVSTWMDEIRSDSTYDYMDTWHWVTVPPGITYHDTQRSSTGDVIWAIERISDSLHQGNLDKAKEEEFLKILIHLVGDIHQPLHVGTGEDRGGNDRKVIWMYSFETNLHSVWDTRIIESYDLSYTELSSYILSQRKQFTEGSWQQHALHPEIWASESIDLRPLIYDIPEDDRLGYAYRYLAWPQIQRRLFEAGYRLAALLNDIYG